MDPQIESLTETFINHGDWLQYAIFLDFTLISPVVHDNSPRIALSKVDFPEPIGPSRTVMVPASSAKLISCIAASLTVGAGLTVIFSANIAMSGLEGFCSMTSVLPSSTLLSEVKNDLLQESSTWHSSTEEDLKYACRRSKQANAAASCGMTASSCSAGDVTRVMMLNEAKACTVFKESFPLTLAWIANTMKEMAGAQILGKAAISVSYRAARVETVCQPSPFSHTMPQKNGRELFSSCSRCFCILLEV